MKAIYAPILAILLLATVAAATEQTNEAFTNECQDFYGDDDYYTLQRWAYTDTYSLEETNSVYAYITIDVTGDATQAAWTANQRFYAALVTTDETTEFVFDEMNNGLTINGKWTGTMTSEQDINTITFCGKQSTTRKVSIDSGHGVPEFPAFAMGAAILVATLGIVILRKN